METRKTNKKNKNKKTEKGDARSRPRTRRTHPCALIIKPTEKKIFADILNEVKKEATLQDVGLAHDAVMKGVRHNSDLDDVVCVRKNYGGMQKATLRLPIQQPESFLRSSRTA